MDVRLRDVRESSQCKKKSGFPPPLVHTTSLENASEGVSDHARTLPERPLARLLGRGACPADAGLRRTLRPDTLVGSETAPGHPPGYRGLSQDMGTGTVVESREADCGGEADLWESIVPLPSLAPLCLLSPHGALYAVQTTVVRADWL